MSKDEKYDVDDISYYIGEINKLIRKDKKGLEDVLDSSEISEEQFKGLSDEAVNTLASNLDDIYHVMLKERDKKFEKKMRKQRLKRGYSDMDVWDIKFWFMNTVRPMLQQLRDTHTGSPSRLGENYQNENGLWVNDTCHDEWDAILDRMIFLLGEMDEEKCSRKNPYDKQWENAHKKFREKYGLFGDGLKSEEELSEEKKKGSHRIYFPSDEPGRDDIKELEKKWRDEEDNLYQYRLNCKDEFFKLFSEYFYDLWD